MEDLRLVGSEIAHDLRSPLAAEQPGTRESGARRATFAPVDLSAPLQALVETYEPVARKLAAGWRPRSRPVSPLRGDAVLNQRFANLIDTELKPPASALPIASAIAELHGGGLSPEDASARAPRYDRPAGGER